MIIDHQAHLRSLLQEAGRQADFYHRRGDDEIAAFWAELEGLAFRARTSGKALVIGVQVKNPPIIKGCE
jgi:hypothetical protein